MKKSIPYMLAEIVCYPIVLGILWFIGTKPGHKFLKSLPDIHI